MEPIATPGIAPDAGPQPDPQEQHAAQMLERAIERSEPEPSEPAARPEPVEQRPERQEPQPPAPAPARPAPLYEHPASRGFMSRVQERAQSRAQRELAERVERAAAALSQQRPAGPAPEEQPEPDFDLDPKAWYQTEMARQLDARLGPIAQRFQQQAETEQQMAERQYHEQQRAQWSESMASEMDQARELYAATPEGQLFDERFDWFVNELTVPGLMATGVPPDQAQFMANAGMQAWTDFAIRRNINPAVFIDTIIRNQVGAMANFLVEAGYTPPNGSGPAPARQAQRQSAEIASLREIGAGAGSVAGVMRQTTAGRSGTGVNAVMADPSVENIRSWAESEFGGDTKKATAALRRAVASASAAR